MSPIFNKISSNSYILLSTSCFQIQTHAFLYRICFSVLSLMLTLQETFTYWFTFSLLQKNKVVLKPKTELMCLGCHSCGMSTEQPQAFLRKAQGHHIKIGHFLKYPSMYRVPHFMYETGFQNAAGKWTFTK